MFYYVPISKANIAYLWIQCFLRAGDSNTLLSPFVLHSPLFSICWLSSRASSSYASVSLCCKSSCGSSSSYPSSSCTDNARRSNFLLVCLLSCLLVLDCSWGSSCCHVHKSITFLILIHMLVILWFFDANIWLLLSSQICQRSPVTTNPPYFCFYKFSICFFFSLVSLLHISSPYLFFKTENTFRV